MELGISSYTYTWAIGVPGHVPEKPLDYGGLLKNAEALDVKLVQVADNLPLHELDEKVLMDFYFSAGDAGIQLEAGARGMTESMLKEYIRIAGIIKSPILRFVIDGPDYKPDTDTILGIIRNAVPALKEKNVILALENYERLKAREFARIIEKAASDRVGICLDSVNSLGAGEGLETVVEMLGPLTVNLHIKEFQIKRIHHQMGFIIEGLPAGEGMLNVPWLLENVSKQCTSAILEIWTPPEEKLEDTISKEEDWAKKSISYLKKIFV